MNPLDMQSPDGSQRNIALIQQLFPQCVTESYDAQGNLTRKIDFDLLRQELADAIVEGPSERYQLTWPGKREAILTANAPTRKTLRPDRAASVNYDTTQNLFIEGDNLEVLKLLQESYLGKVKLIYIDPPYNTGNDFIYKDDFAQDIKTFLQQSGQHDDQGRRLVANAESNGRFHSDWLTMMYARLKLARNLLRDDGVIFVSIDDSEAHNLRLLCEHIFGNQNTEAMIWNKEAEGSSGTLKQTLRFRIVHETIIICYKDIILVEFSKISEPLAGRENEFQTANLAVNESNVKVNHPNWMTLISPTGKSWYKHWKFSNTEIQRLLNEDLIYWGKDGNSQPRLIIPTDHRRSVYATSIINKGGTTQGRKDFEVIMGEDLFNYPKPINLLKHLIKICSLNDDDIILDFFAGSGTTAHAVMQLNAEDGVRRQFVMVQLPEACAPDSEAAKAGFATIAEISKERIRRAGAQVLREWYAKQQQTSFDSQFMSTAPASQPASQPASHRTSVFAYSVWTALPCTTFIMRLTSWIKGSWRCWPTISKLIGAAKTCCSTCYSIGASSCTYQLRHA